MDKVVILEMCINISINISINKDHDHRVHITLTKVMIEKGTHTSLPVQVISWHNVYNSKPQTFLSLQPPCSHTYATGSETQISTY